MRAYIQLLFSLIVPIGILLIVLSIAYFTLDYNFSKAMKLGVLIGFALGLGLSIILALLLTIMRIMQPSKHQSITPIDNSKPEKIKKVKSATQEESKDNTTRTLTHPDAEKIMLLMEKEIAFEIILYAIENQKLGNIISKNLKNGLITFNTKEETQNITVTALTKHTSEVIFQNSILTDETQKIMTFLKEKELSFLDY